MPVRTANKCDQVAEMVDFIERYQPNPFQKAWISEGPVNRKVQPVGLRGHILIVRQQHADAELVRQPFRDV